MISPDNNSFLYNDKSRQLQFELIIQQETKSMRQESRNALYKIIYFVLTKKS